MFLGQNDISDILGLTFSMDADEEKHILYEKTEVLIMIDHLHNYAYSLNPGVFRFYLLVVSCSNFCGIQNVSVH